MKSDHASKLWLRRPFWQRLRRTIYIAVARWLADAAEWVYRIAQKRRNHEKDR